MSTPSLVVNDVIHTTWHGTALEQEIEFGLDWQVTATDADDYATQLLAIATAMAGVGVLSPDLRSDYLTCLGSGYVGYKTSVQRIQPTRDARVDAPWTDAGTGGTGPNASNLAMTFAHASVKTGRSQVAKYHIGPIANSMPVLGYLSLAAIAKLTQLAADTLVPQTVITSGALSVSFKPIIFHRSPNAVPRTDDKKLFRITDTVRTQRRRTVGVGS